MRGAAPTMSESIERVARPSYQRFRAEYLDRNRPVVITGALDDWPALRTWSFEHLASVIGDQRVTPVVLDRGNFYIDLKAGVRYQEMSFRDYVAEVDGKEQPPYYLRYPLDGVTSPLTADYAEPIYCRRRVVLKSNLWVGAAGVSSGLHYDMTHNVVAQVVGRRRVALFGPEQTRYLHPHPIRSLNWHHSPVRVEAPDYQRFPDYARARPIEVDLVRGDLLFIPKGWWHQFSTVERAIAVNFFWLTPRQVPAMVLARAAWTLNGIQT